MRKRERGNKSEEMKERWGERKTSSRESDGVKVRKVERGERERFGIKRKRVKSKKERK